MLNIFVGNEIEIKVGVFGIISLYDYFYYKMKYLCYLILVLWFNVVDKFK